MSNKKDDALDSPDINARIAARIRGLRAQQNLTLDALAQQSAVSRSMLSLIERGESSATAVVLEKIARALGIALAELFDDPAAPASPLARHSDHTPWRDPDSGYVRRNISPQSYPSPFKIIEVVLPHKAKVTYEAGSRELPLGQQVWVQKGVLNLTVGSVSHRLLADDCLAMPLNVTITYHNRSPQPVRYIVVIGPERATPLTR